MLFELKSIIKALPQYWIKEECIMNECQKINTACLLNSDTFIETENTLFITTISHYEKNYKDLIHVNLACISDTTLSLHMPERVSHSLLLIKENYSMEEVAAAINGYLELTGTKRLQNNYEKLMLALSTGKGLQAIADISNEILENPIAIADTSFKMLAVTTVYRNSMPKINMDAQYDAAMVDSISSGQLNIDSIRFLKSSKRNEKCVNNPNPHIIDKNSMMQLNMPSPYNFLDCGIQIKGILVAYMTVGDANRPFEQSDLDYCKYLSNIVALELQKNEFFIHNHGIAYETLLNDLLEDQISDSLQIRLRLQSMNKELKTELYVVTVRRIIGSPDEATVPLVGQSMIRRFFPNCISVVYKNDIVLLVSKDADKSLDIETNEKFLTLLKANHMKVGVSEVFYDPVRMRKNYQQSVKAIELGARLYPEKPVFYYYQVSIFHAMEICAQKISLRDLCHPVIAQLNRSQSESDKDLLRTLYLWLFYERDAIKISSALHIHRSTLFYRINRIKEMIGEDMSNGDLRFQLMFSFKLIQYFSGFVDQSEEYWFKHIPLP